jgi:hypothetical protein
VPAEGGALINLTLNYRVLSPPLSGGFSLPGHRSPQKDQRSLARPPSPGLLHIGQSGGICRKRPRPKFPRSGQGRRGQGREKGLPLLWIVPWASNSANSRPNSGGARNGLFRQPLVDRVYAAAWAQVEAREPFRDQEKEGEGNVRFGSPTDNAELNRDVCFVPEQMCMCDGD